MRGSRFGNYIRIPQARKLKEGLRSGADVYESREIERKSQENLSPDNIHIISA